MCKGENPWDKMPNVDGSRGSSACVENKFGAFIVKVKYGVEVAVAEENLSFQLQVQFVGVSFHAFEQVPALGVGCRILL